MSRADPSAVTAEAKPKPGRILVIEDDWDILEVLKLMLEGEDHEVVTAKHGRAALAAMASSSRPFDLVLMDISMPEMSGIEVAQAMRANPKTADVRIVIHTALEEHWVRARFADYDLFLTKAN
ncbi:MAG: response regulator, partial [Caldimonas sp.]